MFEYTTEMLWLFDYQVETLGLALSILKPNVAYFYNFNN